MAGKESKDDPWAEDDKQTQENQPAQPKPKEGKKLSEKLGEGLNRTKEGTYRSMRKVKEGASIGIFWMKDKFSKPAPAPAKIPNPPPPPPPPSSSP